MGIEDYSTTAASNTSLFPENMPAATVNNSARQLQADTRAWYEDAQWIDLGDTVTYVSATQFTINADVTSTYTVNRRIKTTGTTPFTIYGIITASSYSNPDTTITVVWDSGTMDNTLATAAVGILTPTNSAAQVSIDQIQDGDYTEVGTVGGTADVITGVMSPAITAYAQGQKFSFVAAGPNTTGVTINLDAVGAQSITKQGATALAAGDLISGAVHSIEYDGTQFQVTNPGTVGAGAIDTTELADNAVTLAKMAGGTDGNLITYDSSGDPANVATGTSGQVLTSNGAGAAPTFEDSISSFASTGQTISNSATLAVAHSLGAEPDLIQLVIQCTTANLNYSIGDRVVLSPNINAESTVGGPSTLVDATNVTFIFSSQGIRIVDKTAFTIGTITNGSWQLYVKAYILG